MLERIRRWARRVSEGAQISGAQLRELNDRLDRLEMQHEKLEKRVMQANTSAHLVATGKPTSKVPKVYFYQSDATHTPCPACNSKEVQWLSGYPSDNSRFRMAVIAYCSTCGTGHVIDADRLLKNYYTHEYANTNRKDRNMDPAAYFSQDPPAARYARYFARAKSQVATLARHGAGFDSVLDYGSGPGYFLYISQANEKFAVELDEESDKYLRYLGATKLDPNNMGRDRFDAILASHVVEHFTASTLDNNLINMASALKKGGLILIEVPQAGHSFAILDSGQDPHTLFFTPEGIYRAVECTGLTIVKAFAAGKAGALERDDAIYSPDPGVEFFNTRRGRLTIVARKD